MRVRLSGKMLITSLPAPKKQGKFLPTSLFASLSLCTWSSSFGSPTWKSNQIILLILQVQSATPWWNKLVITKKIISVQRCSLGLSSTNSKPITSNQGSQTVFAEWECLSAFSLKDILLVSAKKNKRKNLSLLKIGNTRLSLSPSQYNFVKNGLNTQELPTELFLNLPLSLSLSATSKWGNNFRTSLRVCNSPMRQQNKNGWCNTYSGSCFSL